MYSRGDIPDRDWSAATFPNAAATSGIIAACRVSGSGSAADVAAGLPPVGVPAVGGLPLLTPDGVPIARPAMRSVFVRVWCDPVSMVAGKLFGSCGDAVLFAGTGSAASATAVALESICFSASSADYTKVCLLRLLCRNSSSSMSMSAAWSDVSGGSILWSRSTPPCWLELDR